MAEIPFTSTPAMSYLQQCDRNCPGGKYDWFSKMLHGHCPDRVLPREGQTTISNVRFVDDISAVPEERQFSMLRKVER